MSTFIYPKTTFGQNLLNSIPKKVCAMLMNEGLSPRSSGDKEFVVWALANKRIRNTDLNIAIQWDKSAKHPENTRVLKEKNVDNSWFENIEQNLTKFVQFEQSIYAAVETYCEQIRKEREEKERNIQALPSNRTESTG